MSTVDTIHRDDPSLDELEARSEHLRTGLADTVGELRNRLSPETIKADVKDHLSQTGQELLAKLERSVRDNPLQTAAIGAGLAYPILGLLRSIPAPILLMGAGVALSGRGNVFAGLTSNPKVTGAVTAGTDKASEFADTASARASAAAASVSSTAQAAADRVSNAAASASTTLSDTLASANQSATDAANSAAHLARTTYHDATDAVNQAASQAAALGRQGRDTLVDTVQRNPLLVGALTALAGAALAAIIPASRTEARLFGDASDSVKAQAKSAAYQGVHAAVDAGERVIGSTLEAARDEGLDTDTGREAIRDVADRAGAVLEAGVKAVVPGNEDKAETPDLNRPVVL